MTQANRIVPDHSISALSTLSIDKIGYRAATAPIFNQEHSTFNLYPLP